MIPYYPTRAKLDWEGNSERGKVKQKFAPRRPTGDIWKILLKEKQLLHFLNNPQSLGKSHPGQTSWETQNTAETHQRSSACSLEISVFIL